jgi:hypothetical protein
MKTPPNTPEFSRFTSAMRTIMRVSKVDIADTEKRKPRASASRASGATSSKRATTQKRAVSPTLPVSSA